MNENENEKVEIKPEDDYIQMFQEFKKNSVSKADYDKLKEENKRLVASIFNGDSELPDQDEEEAQPQVRSKEEVLKSIKDNVAILFSEDSNMTNLEGAQRIIQYHDDMLEYNGTDIFANTGDKFLSSADDKISPQRTYDYLKKCVESSQGDPTAFNVAFQAGLRQILPSKK